MSESYLEAPVLYSSLGGDPDLGELVEMFVDEMPDRIQTISRAFETSNWDELCRSAHQLKGASGSYGFDQITQFAARVETAARDVAEDEISASVQELVTICGKVRAGTPDS